jgi:hypothetical protein
MAHLHLRLLAYSLVNMVCHQLKEERIFSEWYELLRISNSPKAVNTLTHNNLEEVIMIRRCSEPNGQVRKLYDTQNTRTLCKGKIQIK